MNKVIKNFTDLEIYQLAEEIVLDINKLCDSKRDQIKKWKLLNHLVDCAVSIASNIAEGFGRSPKEFGRYLQIALGSVAELETQLEIAYRIDYISDDQHEELTEELTIIGKQLNALQRRVLNTE